MRGFGITRQACLLVVVLLGASVVPAPPAVAGPPGALDVVMPRDTIDHTMDRFEAAADRIIAEAEASMNRSLILAAQQMLITIRFMREEFDRERRHTVSDLDDERIKSIDDLRNTINDFNAAIDGNVQSFSDIEARFSNTLVSAMPGSSTAPWMLRYRPAFIPYGLNEEFKLEIEGQNLGNLGNELHLHGTHIPAIEFTPGRTSFLIPPSDLEGHQKWFSIPITLAGPKPGLLSRAYAALSKSPPEDNSISYRILLRRLPPYVADIGIQALVPNTDTLAWRDSPPVSVKALTSRTEATSVCVEAQGPNEDIDLANMMPVIDSETHRFRTMELRHNGKATIDPNNKSSRRVCMNLTVDASDDHPRQLSTNDLFSYATSADTVTAHLHYLVIIRGVGDAWQKLTPQKLTWTDDLSVQLPAGEKGWQAKVRYADEVGTHLVDASTNSLDWFQLRFNPDTRVLTFRPWRP